MMATGGTADAAVVCLANVSDVASDPGRSDVMLVVIAAAAAARCDILVIAAAARCDIVVVIAAGVRFAALPA